MRADASRNGGGATGFRQGSSAAAARSGSLRSAAASASSPPGVVNPAAGVFPFDAMLGVAMTGLSAAPPVASMRASPAGVPDTRPALFSMAELQASTKSTACEQRAYPMLNQCTDTYLNSSNCSSLTWLLSRAVTNVLQSRSCLLAGLRQNAAAELTRGPL